MHFPLLRPVLVRSSNLETYLLKFPQSISTQNSTCAYSSSASAQCTELGGGLRFNELNVTPTDEAVSLTAWNTVNFSPLRLMQVLIGQFIPPNVRCNVEHN